MKISIEERKARKREYDRLRYANPELHKKAKEYSKQYRANPENKKKAVERSKIWYASNSKRQCESSRRSELKRKYNLTVEDLKAMRVSQKNSCAICLEVFAKTRDMHLDHDHNTGKVRALLCRSCNHMIGNAKEDITRMRAAIKYLKHFQETKVICH